MNAMNDIILSSLDALGLPHVIPEPEVVAQTLSHIRTRSLAGLIVGLLTEHEPMLRAEQEGSSVTVRERGGNAVMRFTITEEA